ncbi:helix-turn-helix transcriptional regulator [Streptomyces radiopugnans]|uniref:AraC-type DNA-binding protein n=1 Tax=Streptomyces radiopugnans TaxID=403935 RepID=A0A1H9JSF1_9ACTN|nr:AraC family transcriptional regulator [Streptomyces radiopugnans]SEQ89816.1 AraC-type DNA-binding protein [Streptomyces radiopugnans]
MCHPAWGRALAQARRLEDLARLRRVRDRIDREYALPLDVEALARGAGMPAGHLARQFRLAYGRSPYAYLTARRIERAAALLLRGGLGVAEARSPAGRTSPGAFTARFTDTARFTEPAGVPPGEVLRRVPETVPVMPGAVGWWSCDLGGSRPAAPGP